MKPVKGFPKLTGLRINYKRWVWEIRLPSEQPNGGNAIWLIAERRNVNSIRVAIDWDTETVTTTIHRRGAGNKPLAGTTPLTWGLRPVMMESPEHFRSFIEEVVVPIYDGVFITK